MVNEEKLKILMIERSEKDADQILQVLMHGGFQVDNLRVTTESALQDALLTHN